MYKVCVHMNYYLTICIDEHLLMLLFAKIATFNSYTFLYFVNKQYHSNTPYIPSYLFLRSCQYPMLNVLCNCLMFSNVCCNFSRAVQPLNLYLK